MCVSGSDPGRMRRGAVPKRFCKAVGYGFCIDRKGLPGFPWLREIKEDSRITINSSCSLQAWRWEISVLGGSEPGLSHFVPTGVRDGRAANVSTHLSKNFLLSFLVPLSSLPTSSPYLADLCLCEREPEKPESSKQSFCTDRAREKMELHFEVLRGSTTTEDNTLRRSSSAPLISGFG